PPAGRPAGLAEASVHLRTRGRRLPGRVALLHGLALLLLAGSAGAQPVEIPDTWGGTLEDRPRLTGSWFGVRDELGKRGVVLDLDLLQTPQGVAGGGREDGVEYGGVAAEPPDGGPPQPRRRAA